MNIKTTSVDTVIIYFEARISEKVLDDVQATYILLKELSGIIDMTPSYCSILIKYDIFYYDHQSIKDAIIKHCSKTPALTKNRQKTKQINIPIDYSQNLDLERVAKHNKLTIKEVIKLHSEHSYRVYAIGFMVGFAYLATVNKQIQTPRLKTPRTKVPKGSVAIADGQTAIYPQDSAGGWNIIGHTTFDAFDTFCVGDSVSFVEI